MRADQTEHMPPQQTVRKKETDAHKSRGQKRSRTHY